MHWMRRCASALALALALAAPALCSSGSLQEERHCTGACRVSQDRPEHVQRMMAGIVASRERVHKSQAEAAARRQALPTTATPCVGGRAGPFKCGQVDMLSRVPTADMQGGGDVSDIWGWVDPQTNKEYALVTFTDGVTIVDVTDPNAPVPLVRIASQPGASARSYWRDVKTYGTTAYITADAVAGHGIQVFDLTRLRGATGPLQVVQPDYLYTEHGAGHNIFIHEETGFGYSVGSDTCSYGLHIFDLRTNPLRPTFVGCVYDDKAPAPGAPHRRGYSHDLQCVVYAGPDAAYTGREICVSYGEDELHVFDVTDKTVADANTQRINAPILSATSYPGVRYTHQGWFTADQKYILVNDELDEEGTAQRTKTFLFDMSSLQAPVLLGTSLSPVVAIDHNLFIKGQLAYMSNYQSGLRVDDITPMTAGTGTQLPEVGFFQTQTIEQDTADFMGSWGNYPFLPSNNLLVADISNGLFVLRYTGEGDVVAPPAGGGGGGGGDVGGGGDNGGGDNGTPTGPVDGGVNTPPSVPDSGEAGLSSTTIIAIAGGGGALVLVVLGAVIFSRSRSAPAQKNMMMMPHQQQYGQQQMQYPPPSY